MEIKNKKTHNKLFNILTTRCLRQLKERGTSLKNHGNKFLVQIFNQTFMIFRYENIYP